MATVVFIGSQANVAQVDTVQITGYDAATTYILTIGAGNLTHVISVAGTTDVDGTAAALATAWSASTHAYAKYITASDSTDTVTLTADTAGVPNTVVASVTGGTGTIGAVTSSVAMVSHSDVDDAANYEGGAKAGVGDTFIHDKNAPALAWGLDQSAVTGATFHHPRGAGNIGLNRMAFAISADGQTADDTAREYRDDYLQMDMDDVYIGAESGPTTIAAATRIKLHNTNVGASNTRVFSVAGVSMDSGMPTLRMTGSGGTTDFEISSCAGGFGSGVESDNEVSIIGDIVVTDPSGVSNVTLGRVCTWATYEQLSGNAKLYGTGITSSIIVRGGTVEVFGAYTLTTATVEGSAVLYYSTEGSLTTLNSSGTVDTTRQSIARTITNYNPTKGAVLKLNGADVTVTNWNAPTDLHTVTYS